MTVHVAETTAYSWNVLKSLASNALEATHHVKRMNAVEDVHPGGLYKPISKLLISWHGVMVGRVVRGTGLSSLWI